MLLQLLLLLTSQLILAQDFPCSVLTLDDIKEDSWTGLLTLDTKSEVFGVYIKLEFDREISLLINNFGPSVTHDNRIFLIENHDSHLYKNSITYIRIIVRFKESKNEVPKVIKLDFNGRTVCPSEKQQPVEEKVQLININAFDE